LQRFADRMEENQQNNFKSSQRNFSYTPWISTAPQSSNFQPAADAMDWEPTVVVRGQPRAAKWVSETEIAARHYIDWGMGRKQRGVVV
jgi:hypothetical protein